MLDIYPVSGTLRLVPQRMNTLTDQVRQAIEDSGLTRYAISQQTGIDQSALSRFMSGKTGLTLASLDRLAETLSLQIVVNRSTASRKGK